MKCFSLQTITPTISATVAELPQTWVNCPVNFDIIDCKVKNGLYQYPYQLLNDLSLINHSLRIAHRDYNFSQYLINFMANIYSLFNRCEACPYCLESSFSDRPNWITETCPWGHPLIFVNLRGEYTEQDEGSQTLSTKFTIQVSQDFYRRYIN